MFARTMFWGVALVAVLAQGAGAIIMHDAAQSNPSWQQEYINLGKQYDSVVAFYGYNGTGWQNIGSGTVISDHCVLGAAHVAHYSNYCMVEGNNLTSDYWSWFYTTNVTISPLYTGIGSTDMAIWTFSDTITSSKVAAATLYTGADSALLGSVVDFIGFGYTGYVSSGATVLDGAKRGCEDMLDQLGYAPFGCGNDQLVMYVAAPGSSEYQHLGGRGASLDSGGGWFVNGELVGVNDWGVTTYGYGTPCGATSVSQHLDWINSVTGLPEPSALLLIGAGAVTCFRRRRR